VADTKLSKFQVEDAGILCETKTPFDKGFWMLVDNNRYFACPKNCYIFVLLKENYYV